jgi:hypothetical protein
MVSLSGSTRISLAFAFSGVMVIVSACGFVYKQIAAFDSKIEAVATEMRNNTETLKTMIESKAADRYTLTMAAENALRGALANPGVRFPDPRNPGQFFVVEKTASR